MIDSSEQILDRKEARRLADDARWEDRREKLEAEAEKMVGELIRDGKVMFYINVLTRTGEFNGKTKEFTRQYEAIDYLIRNKYV